MQYFVFALEIVGTLAFAISGSAVGINKGMDLFGVTALGFTTACGGGLVRDMILNRLPPTMFVHPVFALIALAAGIITFIFYACRRTNKSRATELTMLIADSAGLGIFTVTGVQAVVSCGYGDNLFYMVFLGLITGVGGGLMRDIMAKNPPYIFVKHIYASASIAGALVCALIWKSVGANLAMMIGCAVIFVIRLLAAHFRWSLPRITT